MALVEDVIFSDPVLQRIFFERRWFAARTPIGSSKVAGLDGEISEHKVKFQKAQTPAVAEYYQRKMRGLWFEIRSLCDGYVIKMPAGFDDGCEHVEMFAHESGAACFEVNFKARAALWKRYARRSAPDWRAGRSRTRRGRTL